MGCTLGWRLCNSRLELSRSLVLRPRASSLRGLPAHALCVWVGTYLVARAAATVLGFSGPFLASCGVWSAALELVTGWEHRVPEKPARRGSAPHHQACLPHSADGMGVQPPRKVG